MSSESTHSTNPSLLPGLKSRPWMRAVIVLLGLFTFIPLLYPLAWFIALIIVSPDPLNPPVPLFFNDTVLISIVAVSLSLIIPMSITLALFVYRARKSARANRGRVCIHCLYDLSTSPPDGKCPECGEKYTHDDLLEYWGVRDSQ